MQTQSLELPDPGVVEMWASCWVRCMSLCFFGLIVHSELNGYIQASNEKQHQHTNHSLMSEDMAILYYSVE